MTHKSRVAYLVIDCADLERAAQFWSAAVGGPIDVDQSFGDGIYRIVKLPDSDIRLLMQLVPEDKATKSRVHIDIESSDVEAEVARLVELGARRQMLVDERDVRFWVLQDPFGNEFCVVGTNFSALLERRPEW